LAKNSFTLEGIARGVSLDKLYEFYTDYSPEDVQIMKRHGLHMALERVAQRDGNHVVVDTVAKVMGGTKNMRYDILLHPETYWYEMTISIDGFLKSRRTYKFEKVTQGTKIIINDEYEPESLPARMMNTLGLLKRRMVNDTVKTMNAFVAEAEERFGASPIS